MLLEGETTMSIFDLSITAAYHKLQRSLTSHLHSRKAAAIERSKARTAAERQNAAINLLLDDAKFQGVSPASLLGTEREELGYKSCLGEDFPDDL
jgi:hypothetical protein